MPYIESPGQEKGGSIEKAPSNQVYLLGTVHALAVLNSVPPGLETVVQLWRLPSIQKMCWE
jgi:hypothetical protein